MVKYGRYCPKCRHIVKIKTLSHDSHAAEIGGNMRFQTESGNAAISVNASRGTATHREHTV